jgi:hydrogenase-4 component E
MSDLAYVQLLDAAAAAALVAAVLVLWRRSLTAIVMTLAIQGCAVAGLAMIVGVREQDPRRVVVALAILLVKAVIVPVVLLRAARAATMVREAAPLVNVSASLLVAGLLTVFSYGVTGRLVAASPGVEAPVIPLGLAVVLIGLFAMVSRRTALAQAVGFLLIDNGITVVALLAGARVPTIVEFGVLLDVMLAVLVLQALVSRMQLKFGTTDLDQLRELRD